MENTKQLVFLGVTSLCLVGLWYKRDLLKDDLLSIPPRCDDSQIVLKNSRTDACHISANALFTLLTGYDSMLVDFLSSGKSVYELDKNAPAKECVHYFAYVWNENDGKRGTNLTHHVIYYQGYIYQSYKTDRYRWTTYLTDGYPLLRTALTNSDIYEVFSQNPEKLTVEQFNEWCAPSNHPILEDVPFRLVRHYSALLNPGRSLFSLELTNLSQSK